MINVNYFCVRATKIGGNTTNILTAIFQNNLKLWKSDYISAYGKLNVLPISSNYLVFSSLEMQVRLKQPKKNYKFFYCLKINISKTFKKWQLQKTSFPRVYITDATCFDECFFFHVITEMHFSYKFIVTRCFCATAMLLRSLKQVLLKSAFYIRYLHNNITVLQIPKARNKASTS